MADKDLKSVLSFYRIESDLIFEMSIEDIWTGFVMSKVEGVSCSNVYHFEISTDQLLFLIKNKDYTNELFSDIKSQYDAGATVMFIKPVVGSPIDGFLLHKFFSN
jgi:hypothetical protein